MRKKIELEYPYNTKWKYGIIFTNGEGRKHISLVKTSNGTNSLTSYARYLVAVHKGRFLFPNEQVDHINHDNTNDTFENLQILTVTENNRKHARYIGNKIAEIKCPTCGVVFQLRSGLTQAVKSKKGKVTCCSKKCSYMFKTKTYTTEEREQISEQTLLRVFQQRDNG